MSHETEPFDPKATGVADGRPVPLANDHGGEELLNEFCAEFCVNAATAMEMLEWFEEKMPSAGGRGTASEDEMLKKFVDYERESLMTLDGYFGRQRGDPKFMSMAFLCYLLAKGWPHLAGASTPTEIARKLDLKVMFGQSGKQTARECLEYFRKRLKSPPMPGQRGEAGCKNMAAARKAQLKDARINDSK
jgi:hypothetical protein